MLISEYKKKFLNQLKEEYPGEEANSLFHLLVKHFLGWERLDLALNPSKKISSAEEEKLDAALGRLLSHEPIQYITGETEFYGFTFKVNKNVLVPRPETEELVEWIKEDLISSGKERVNILDVGTGSGCIAVSLAKIFPQSKVSAIDVSAEALKVAAENAKENRTTINLIHADIFNLESLPGKFDVIVSNPPYVREHEKNEMQRNVLEYEPSLALYVKDNDPLIFYKKITKLAIEGLHPGGKLYFEINQYLGDQTLKIIKDSDLSGEIKKDIFGNDRMLRAIIKA